MKNLAIIAGLGLLYLVLSPKKEIVVVDPNTSATPTGTTPPTLTSTGLMPSTTQPLAPKPTTKPKVTGGLL